MTETNPEMPGPDDPRSPYAVVTMAVRELMDGVRADQLGNATPCADFSVKELLEHMVLVQRRSAAIGNGQHWTSTEEQPQDSGWAESFGEASHAVMEAWTDSSKLGQQYEVPWGTIPGAGLLVTYTAELAVHGWDLAQATGADFSIDDNVLGGALVGVKFIPAEGRDVPEVPFGPVVDPGPGASALDQIAGWLGRDVSGAAS